MKNVVVHKEIVIERPINVVRAQFADMRHHEAHRVHSTLQVSNVRVRSEGSCMFTGRRSVMGVAQEDDVEVAWQSDGRLTLRSVQVSNAGLLITQTFTAEGADRTRVKTSVDMPLRGAARCLAPRSPAEREAQREHHGSAAQGVLAVTTPKRMARFPDELLSSCVRERRRYNYVGAPDRSSVMNEIIQRLIAKTGLSEEQAASAVQIVAGFLKEKLPAPIAAQVDNVLQGSGATDALGGLGGALGGMFGKS